VLAVEESTFLALLGLPGVSSVQEVRAQNAVKHYVVKYELQESQHICKLVHHLASLWPFSTIEIDQENGVLQAEFLVRPGEVADFYARASLLPLPRQVGLYTLALEFAGPVAEEKRTVLETRLRSTDSVAWRGDRVAVVHLNNCGDPAAVESRITAVAENIGLQVRTIVGSGMRQKSLALGA